MDTQALQHWLTQLSELSPNQRIILQKALNAPPQQAVLEGRLPDLSSSAHTATQRLSYWHRGAGVEDFAGNAAELARRTCNTLTGTALAHLRKAPRWIQFAQTLINGLTVRKEARLCGISKNTALSWHHRFLASAATHKAKCERGIVEADETFFLESFKGQRHLPRAPRKRGGVGKTRGTGPEQIPVIVVRDHEGNIADFHLVKLDARHVQEALMPLIDSESVLCTDGAGVYAAFARASGITHQIVHARPGQRVQQGFFISRMSTLTTADSKVGWPAFMESPPTTLTITWGGDACWSDIQMQSSRPTTFRRLWGGHATHNGYIAKKKDRHGGLFFTIATTFSPCVYAGRLGYRTPHPLRESAPSAEANPADCCG